VAGDLEDGGGPDGGVRAGDVLHPVRGHRPPVGAAHAEPAQDHPGGFPCRVEGLAGVVRESWREPHQDGRRGHGAVLGDQQAGAPPAPGDAADVQPEPFGVGQGTFPVVEDGDLQAGAGQVLEDPGERAG
jgi:hypothetical protein